MLHCNLRQQIFPHANLAKLPFSLNIFIFEVLKLSFTDKMCRLAHGSIGATDQCVGVVVHGDELPGHLRLSRHRSLRDESGADAGQPEPVDHEEGGGDRGQLGCVGDGGSAGGEHVDLVLLAHLHPGADEVDRVLGGVGGELVEHGVASGCARNVSCRPTDGSVVQGARLDMK